MSLKTFHLKKDREGIYSIIFDTPGEKVNKLKSELFLELDEMLFDLKNNQDIKLLLIRSAKDNNFVAGADINEIAFINDDKEASDLCNKGLDIFNKIEDLPFPTIAVIHGSCLGGGLELALACTYRVCTDDKSTIIGLPEVNLGIFPGLGGSQRLPRLIGLQRSLPLILGGKIINGSKAKRLGIADACFHYEYLEHYLFEFIDKVTKNPKKIIQKRKPKGFTNLILEKTSIGRGLIFKAAKKSILKQTKGNYPAPLAAIKAIKKGYGKPLKKALRIETKYFAPLPKTDICKNLIRLFFISEKIKKDKGIPEEIHTDNNEVNASAVLGAGVMGSGIAWILNRNDIDVILKDTSFDYISSGLQRCKKNYDYYLKTRKMKKREVDRRMLSITGQTDYNGFKSADIVIEAVFEDLEVKNKILKEIEENSSSKTIIASNTSSLSINEMSENLKNPERFIGLHFFNPVNRMPLVEIIKGKNTNPQTIATTVALAKKLKKTPIVVNDSPGFLVNRVLLPYMNEAIYLLEENVSIKRVDQLMEKFGMPMGPFALIDEVGLDVAFKVSEIFESKLGDSSKMSSLVEELKGLNITGKKGGKGFYIYSKKKKEINPKIEQLISTHNKKHPVKRKNISDEEITERLIYRMINEASKCLNEGVISDADYVDMGMIMGTGFPPFRGGILRYADKTGLENVSVKLGTYYKYYGERFSPCSKLADMSKSGKKYTY